MLLELTGMQDLDRAGSTHHGDLRVWLGKVHVRADVFAAHDDISTPVGLAQDDGQLGHRRLTVGIGQLGAMAVLTMRPGVVNSIWQRLSTRPRGPFTSYRRMLACGTSQLRRRSTKRARCSASA